MSNMSQELMQKLHTIESLVEDLNWSEFNLLIGKLMQDRAEYQLDDQEEESLALAMEDFKKNSNTQVKLKNRTDIKSFLKSAKEKYVRT